MSPDHLENRRAKSDRSNGKHLPRMGKTPKAGAGNTLRGSGGQSCGGSRGCIHPMGFGVLRALTCPSQGLQAQTCCLVGAEDGKPRGVSAGAADALCFLLASRRPSIPPLPAVATVGGGPPHPQAGRGRAGASPQGGLRGGTRAGATGTHPLGDGAAPGALPLLPRVDDLLNADGLALLAIPARGQASAPLVPTMLTSPPCLPSWAPHKPPLTSWDPTHPHGTPLSLRSLRSPSQDATLLHWTPLALVSPPLMLMGHHSPSWDPIHLHRTPLTLTSPPPPSPSQPLRTGRHGARALTAPP